MKRWLCLLILLAMLCGCSPNADIPAETGSPAAPDAQQPTGIYDAENEMEKDTAGYIKAYRLENGDFRAMIPMGENFLMFGESALTVLTGEAMVPTAKISVQDLPEAYSGMIRVFADGVLYFDSAQQAIIRLDGSLREVHRLSLTETVSGSVYLTPDGSQMYYCCQGSVRVMDLLNGDSRLLKEQDGNCRSIDGGLFDGQILRCSLETEDGAVHTLLISAQTGQTLAQGGEFADMQFGSSWYFLSKGEEWIVGKGEQQPHNFLRNDTYRYIPLLEIGGIAAVESRENGVYLHYYDLSTGKHTGAIPVQGITEVSNMTTDGTDVWFVSEGVLYRWAPESFPCADQQVYTLPRYTREDPDEAGLAALELRVQALEQRYGVEILFWEEPEGKAPWDYSFETEFQTEPFAKTLDALEKAMGQFPDDFFVKAAAWTDSGVLQILLVKGIYGPDGPEEMNSAAGIQYLKDGVACIALTLGEGAEQNFYHTVGHLVNTVVLSNCAVFYEWNKLNPAGFRYDNDYIANQNRTDQKYLTGNNRYFIDTYSMSFEVEDRARILEYACMPGKDAYFTSAHMQTKLSRVCKGIREAFGLKDDPTAFIWEQYLK